MVTAPAHDTTATYDDTIGAASASCRCGWSAVVPHARKTGFAAATAVRLAGALGRQHENNPEGTATDA